MRDVFIGRDGFGGAERTLLMPLILFPASTVVEGLIASLSPMPVAAAAPAIAATARNFRRSTYKLLGVISEERMSSAFLINMGIPFVYTRAADFEQISSSSYLQLNMTLVLGKSCMEPKGARNSPNGWALESCASPALP
jgi:hypothetical protein